MKQMSFLAVAAAALLVANPAQADVRLPAIFSDHMVVQRDMPIAVWGWSEPGEKVTVMLGDATAEVEGGGRWRVTLKPMKAGGPHTLTVKGRGNTITVGDVLVGEVWLASGQSNMAMAVSRAANPEAEAAAADYPQIRMFTVTRDPQPQPVGDVKGDWVVCSPQTVSRFSATAYFFGRELHKQLGVPVGLINSSVGGTAVEAWTSVPAQREIITLSPILDAAAERAATYDAAEAKQAYEEALARWQEAAKKAKAADKKAPRRPRAPLDPKFDPNTPGNLYNGMIAPLVGYTLRGAIWYQGERNTRAHADLYAQQLATLARSWRLAWGEVPFPFYFVQLPNYMARVEEPVQDHGWVVSREQMTRAEDLIPNSGMAVTIDIGEADDIHPRNKQEVGRRLGLIALAKTYGKDAPHSGPRFASMKREGDTLVLTFDHAAGLRTADGRPPLGFAVAGPDHQWHHADARIDGHRVIIDSGAVKAPAAVRYAWKTNPAVNLVNEAGLPAAPFRTDDWPLE